MPLIKLVTCALLGTSVASARAAGVGGALGGEWTVGNMGNPGLGVPQRRVNAVVLDGLIGYRFGRLSIGPHLDYRWVGQLTEVNNAGGLNLKGHGWLAGVGGEYTFSTRWSAFLGVDGTGRYVFDKQTAGREDDHLERPLGVRVRAQYFPWTNKAISIDLGAQLISYRVWQVSAVEHSERTSGVQVGAAVTWHFPTSRPPGPNVPANPDQTPTASPDSREPAGGAAPDAVPAAEVATLPGAHETPEGIQLDLSGGYTFATGRADLSPAGLALVERIAAALSGNSQRVVIDGHTDSSGSRAQNQKLSQQRAAAVRDALVSRGVDGARLTARGYGPDRPKSSNATAEGRAVNRRVEILINNPGT